MPNMIEGRYLYKSAAIKNKLYLVEGYPENCEVNDSFSDKFAPLELSQKYIIDYLSRPKSVISIGSKLALFEDCGKFFLFYNVETGEWSEETWGVTNNLENICCAKLPQF